MKHLIKIANGQPVVSSKVVADEFGCEHKNLMQNLRSLIDSGHLGELDFKPSSYQVRRKTPSFRAVRMSIVEARMYDRVNTDRILTHPAKVKLTHLL